jgi:ABC-2 type transport system ATP-binding protein
MRQRLGIAASLLRAPSLLLLDEPSSGLDPAGVRDLGALLRRLSGDGVAVLLSSHQIGEVERVCDSFTFLHRGREAWSGTASELRDQAPALEYRLRTSDDAMALEIAGGHPGVRVTPAGDGGLRLQARARDLDPYTVQVGTRGVAIRSLEVVAGPLETMFFAHTGELAEPVADAAASEPPAQQRNGDVD